MADENAAMQAGLFDLTQYLKTAPCVPALRRLVKEWRESDYQGSTSTTRALLHYWFLKRPQIAQWTTFQLS